MRISRQQAEQNRDRVVDAAARLLRENGLDGVGVDALAEAAGLTHGAVYSHFRSKDDLAAAAVSHALHQSMVQWQALTEGFAGADAFAKLLKVYVSRAHRDRPGEGCSITALGADAPRGEAALQRAFTAGVAAMIDIVAEVSDGATDRDKRASGIANAAAMVGAVVMARAAAADPKLSDEILKTVRQQLLAERG